MSSAAVRVARWMPSTRVKHRHSSLLLTSETVTPQRECRLRDICYRDSGSAMEEGCHVAFCPSEAKCYTQKSCHASWLSPASSYAPRAATLSRPSSRQMYCKVRADTGALCRASRHGTKLAKLCWVWKRTAVSYGFLYRGGAGHEAHVETGVRRSSCHGPGLVYCWVPAGAA